MESLHIKVYRTLSELETLRSEWEQLLGKFPGATTFSSLEWLVPWWQAFGRGELLVLAFLDGSDRLVGLAPLSLEKQRLHSAVNLRVLRFWGDGSGDSDNLDFPAQAGYEDQIAVSLLDYLAKESGTWDYCELNTTPADSAVGRCLERQLSQRRWTTYRQENVAALVPLPETWEAYLAQLSTKERGKIGYLTKRLRKKYRVRVYKCENEAQARVCLPTLFELHQKRWQKVDEPGSFRLAARRQFYDELTNLLLARDRLEFWLLDLDEEPVAAQFGFRFGGTVFALQEGFDPQYSSDSVGYVLRAHVLSQLIPAGVRCYHFLAGDGPAKARWGTQTTHYIDLHFARPFSLGAIYLNLVNGMSASKEWLRDQLPPNIWRALHRLNRTISDSKKPPEDLDALGGRD